MLVGTNTNAEVEQRHLWVYACTCVLHCRTVEMSCHHQSVCVACWCSSIRSFFNCFVPFYLSLLAKIKV